MSNEKTSTPRRSPGRRLHGGLSALVGRLILTGKYKPGEYLPPEITHAEMLGVSRVAYREAVQVLVGKRLVESRTRYGTSVLAKAHWNIIDADVLEWAFTDGLNLPLLQSLLELCGIVLPAAASLAAERRSRRDIDHMMEALRAMRKRSMYEEIERSIDGEFHAALLRSAKNPMLFMFAPAARRTAEWSMRLEGGDLKSSMDSFESFRDTMEAVMQRDGAAASASMASHVHETQRKLDLLIRDTSRHGRFRLTMAD